MLKKLSVVSFFILFLLIIFSSTAGATGEIQRIVSLVDYIGGDYKNAVQSGKVINDLEYQEMLDFSSSILKLSRNTTIDQSYIDQFEELSDKITGKADPLEVNAIAFRLKDGLISQYSLKSYPGSKPDLQAGKLIFESNCSTCHGVAGKGDGVLSGNLVPAPTNFTDKETVPVLSPFKIYNTVTFGIEGTAMPSFKTLKDREKWDVAFYVASLGYKNQQINDKQSVENMASRLPADIKDYKKLSTLSNEELLNISGKYVDRPESAVAFLRNTNLTSKNSDNPADPINYASTKLASSLEHYKSNNKTAALNESIDAYLEGFEKVESKLATKNSSLLVDIEKKFSVYRSSIKAGEETAVVEKLNSDIQKDLDEAGLILSSNASISAYVTFLNSFSIIVREALEAVLIIAAIIAFLYASGSKHAVKYIHFGWIAAILCGFITWFIASNVVKISGAQREVIEGVTSLMAAAVLFYVSYWLISKIEVNKWKHYIKDKLNKALNRKSIFALMSVSFLAVYREAFETVLFYQALIYQSESAIPEVIWGLLIGIVFITAVMIVVHKMALKIPLKYFFSFTSLFLYFLCFILVGKGIKELQGAGYITTTGLGWIPYIDFLGIYPTYETIIPQAIILLAFVVAFCWIAYVTNVKERNEITQSVTKISEEIKTIQLSFDHLKGHIVEWKKCENIDMEAEELDNQIHEAYDHFNQLKVKLDKFNLTVGDS